MLAEDKVLWKQKGTSFVKSLYFFVWTLWFAFHSSITSANMFSTIAFHIGHEASIEGKVQPICCLKKRWTFCVFL